MGKRLLYLDNLRVALTVLVIVFHTSIAYGGSGSWYLEDADKSEINATIVLFTIFTAVCQAFFMALFFFISGYFTPQAYDRKGPMAFLKDRLIRLGIPLLLYMFWIGPSVIYLSVYRNQMSYMAFVKNYIFHAKIINFGPLWFAEALIYFAVIYTLFRLATRGNAQLAARTIPFPTGKRLLAYALGFGLVAYLVRLVYPTGTGLLELQLGYFPLYVLLFIAGMLARRHGWLEQLPDKLVKRWLVAGLVCIPLLPVILIMTGALEGEMNFSGGWNMQAFAYAMWEPFVCFGLCLGLIGWFRKRWSKTGPLLAGCARSAYTAYIIHPLAVVGMTLLMKGFALAPAVKFLIVAPASVVLCFAAAMLITALPIARKVL